MHIACPVCTLEFQSGWAVLITREFRIGTKAVNLNYHVCSACRTAATVPQLTAEESEAFFGRSKYGKPELAAFWKLRSAGLFHYLLDLIERQHPQKGALLDVGCSLGFLLVLARERGWEVKGLDLIRAATEYAREQGIPAKCTTLRRSGFDDGCFDVVTYMDTFYYVTDPLGELAEINRVLKPGGLLVMRLVNRLTLLRITLPLERLPLLGQYSRRARQRLLGDAMVLYDVATLRKILRLAGFEPLIVPHFGPAEKFTVASAQAMLARMTTGCPDDPGYF